MEDLQSDVRDFESRSKSIFDSLLALETDHKTREAGYVSQSEQLIKNNEAEFEECVRSLDNSNFKVPSITSYKRKLSEGSNSVTKNHKKTPGHIANPDKWKKYSLEDVDSSQMSNSANYFAAMNFLKKNENKPCEDFQRLADNIVFNKPIGANKMDSLRPSYSKIGKNLLDKLNEEQEEIEEEIETEKMEISEIGKSESLFKKKGKSRNIRSQKKSQEEDTEVTTSTEGVSNSDVELKEDLDAVFNEYKTANDGNEDDNGFGEDFDKY